MAQISKLLVEWPRGVLLSDIVVITKGQCNAIYAYQTNSEEANEENPKQVLQVDKFFDKFIELDVNLSIEDIEKKLPYDKHFNGVLENEVKEHTIVDQAEECSMVIQKKIPPKLVNH